MPTTLALRPPIKRSQSGSHSEEQGGRTQKDQQEQSGTDGTALVGLQVGRAASYQDECMLPCGPESVLRT